MDRNGVLGRIEVTPFKISIKGLDTEFDYEYKYKKSEWSKLIGFL